jgi:hypothetical protein
VRTIAFILVAVIGCTSPANPAPDAAICGVGYLGDPNKDIDFEFRLIGSDAIDVPIKDGGDVPLVFPPQGGRVIFVGVRATNIDPCAVQLTGAIRDTNTKQVRVDARTINLNPDGQGWGTSGVPAQSINAAISNYSNIPLCPNQWASNDIFDHDYQLEVTVKDRAKRTLTKTIHVTPRCVETGSMGLECQCICKVNYTLGEICSTDAGDQ